MEEILEYLNGPASGHIGVSGGLVDKEGFPIDDTQKVINVRTKRNRLACLKTDLKELTKQIEAGLLDVHKNSSPSVSNRVAKEEQPQDQVLPKAFALIDAVDEGGPAFLAGLRIGDGLVGVGGQRGISLSVVGQLVKKAENASIEFEVVRGKQLLKLVAEPRVWVGKGILGCHFSSV